jgi:hypothetical protein
MERHGRHFQSERTTVTQAWSAPTRENATAKLVLVCALKVMTEWHVKELSVPMIVRVVGSVSLKRLLPQMLQRLMKPHGMLKSTLDVNAISVIVALTVL